MPTSEFLTVEEAAACLRIPKGTMYKIIRDDSSLKVIKLGKHIRIRNSDFISWLEKK